MVMVRVAWRLPVCSSSGPSHSASMKLSRPRPLICRSWLSQATIMSCAASRCQGFEAAAAAVRPRERVGSTQESAMSRHSMILLLAAGVSCTCWSKT